MALFPSILKKIKSLFSQGRPSFEELEKVLYEADLGVAITRELIHSLKDSSQDPIEQVKKTLLSFCIPPKHILFAKPHVILMVGANGSGKTTTIGKLAYRFHLEGKSVLIAAGDTFRAASTEQLEIWAKTSHALLVKSTPGSDPAAVAFDAISSAKAKGIDVVLIDTAGRLQNKQHLMQELAKIQRAIQKQILQAPHETLLTLDATIGQNALEQARVFHSFTPLTGLVLTKWDGSAKGGMAIVLQKELSLPILWVGTGESKEKLERFDPEAYIQRFHIE